MQHQHGPNCGCTEYAFAENSQDLLHSINFHSVKPSFYPKFQCLNERHPNTGKVIFHQSPENIDFTKFVYSDEDPELLFIIT